MVEKSKMVTIGIVAGESSGDLLGAGLMRALQASEVQLRFVGVGGDKMEAAGLEPFFPMRELNVHGFREPLARLPQLWVHFRNLARFFLEVEIDLFVGVDFNVFNLLLEKRLKRRGFPTVHYVSPSVYAWRRGRIKSIARSADVLLALFPFEPPLYRASPVKAIFVGHPLADAIDPEDFSSPDKKKATRQNARSALGISSTKSVVALLPGSRRSELALMAPVFIAAAQLYASENDVQFVIPCIRKELRSELDEIIRNNPMLDIHCYEGDGRLALLAADAALVKSGTSTLEAMLCRCPMVVAYRLGYWTYAVARLLVRSPFVALPNLISGRQIVPEWLQDQATPANLAQSLRDVVKEADQHSDLITEYARLHDILRRNADHQAAKAIAELLVSRPNMLNSNTALEASLIRSESQTKINQMAGDDR